MNPGASVSAGSDLATGGVADGTNAVPGLASAGTVPMAKLTGEVLRRAPRVDGIGEVGWFQGRGSRDATGTADNVRLRLRQRCQILSPPMVPIFVPADGARICVKQAA